MKDVLLSESLRLGQKITVLLLFALTILNLTLQETWGGEHNHIQRDATICVALKIFGGFEGRRTRTEIDSRSLFAEEVTALRQMINDAQFFDLPETMTSSKQQCFDCYHYEITIESQGQRHTVYINTERIEPPLTLRPLLDWLLKRSPPKGEVNE